MNVVHPLTPAATASAQVDCSAEHILATTSEARGLITYANSDFCQVSGFDAGELLGAPYRIVRHPDMPRGVFHLCWQRLKSGQPVAAYIKNSTKSGNHTWVFALMMPQPDGYLSMGICPGGDHFDSIRSIYKAAQDRETGGMAPEDSCHRLIADIRALGFAGYTEFMIVALGDEIAQRAQQLNRKVPARIHVLTDLADRVRSMISTASNLGEGFRNIRNEPVNMRILSNRLESGGASISMISQNYDTMAQEMSQNFDRLTDRKQGALTRIWQATGDGCLAILTALLIRELAANRNDERTAGNAQYGASVIDAHADRLEQRANEEINNIIRSCSAIPEVSRQLRRRINGLDVVKLLCRVENCRFGSRDAGLTAIIERLEGFHSETDALLGVLTKEAMQITQTANGLT